MIHTRQDSSLHVVNVPLPDGSSRPLYYRLMPGPITAEFVQIRQELRERPERCVVCHACLCVGDLVTMLLSNNKVIPNCCVHTACWTASVQQAQDLVRSYHEAQRYACWF
jgi:hypothetical protein